jgi:hypothetical protein
VDRGTICNGELDIRSTKAHQPGTLDALVANELTNACSANRRRTGLKKATGFAASQMPSGSVNH